MFRAGYGIRLYLFLFIAFLSTEKRNSTRPSNIDIFGIKPKVLMRVIILSDLFESRVALNPGLGGVRGHHGNFSV